MANDSSPAPATGYEAPEAARPYLALARLGKEKWNRWVRTGLDDNEAQELGLAEVEVLSEAHAQELVEKFGLLPLRDHLRPPNFDDVDFRQENIDFSGFVFATRRRDEMRFRSSNDLQIERDAAVLFRRANFGDWADFKGAKFGDLACFDGATFGMCADFDGATFRDRASFDGATFGGGERFPGVTFGRKASFYGATLGAFARFDGAVFGDWSTFAGATFRHLARFEGATFGDWTTFENAVFGPAASFDGQTKDVAKQTFSQLLDRVYGQAASEVRTRALARWEQAATPDRLRSFSFSRARFLGACSFRNRTFTSSANFSGATFHDTPEFAGGDGFGHLDLSEISLSFSGRRWWYLRNWTTRSDIDAGLRRLRKIAKDVEAHDLERDLFVLERQAQRGIQFRHLVRPFAHPWVAVWNGGRIDRAKLADNLRGRNPFRPLGLTLLLFFYGIVSDYGRSLARPLLWFMASTAGFHALYQSRLHAARGKLVPLSDPDLISYTLGNALPFAGSLNPARRDVFLRLFGVPKESGPQWPFLRDLLARVAGPPELGLQVPQWIEWLSFGQSILGAVLLFLFLLAVRNRFRIT